MSALAARLHRPPYERAGEYRRPGMRAKPLTQQERDALRAASSVPRHRWHEVLLQRLPDPGRPYLDLACSKPGELVEQPRPATEAAPPTVLVPVPAENNPAPSVPRAEAKIQKPMLGELARATLERFRKRYGL